MKIPKGLRAALREELLESVLAKLELADRPQPTLQGLQAVYSAWCRRVPFGELCVRLNRGNAVIGAAFGRRIEIDGKGRISQSELKGNERLRFLIDEIGIHEELAHALPPDRPPPQRPAAVAGMMAGTDENPEGGR